MTTFADRPLALSRPPERIEASGPAVYIGETQTEDYPEWSPSSQGRILDIIRAHSGQDPNTVDPPDFPMVASHIVYQDWQKPIDFAVHPQGQQELAERRDHVGHLFGVWHSLLSSVPPENLPNMIDAMHQERVRYREQTPWQDMTLRLFAIVRGLRQLDTLGEQSFTAYLSDDHRTALQGLHETHAAAKPFPNFLA